MEANLGFETFATIPFVPGLSLDTQHRLADPFHSPKQRAERMQQWFTYISEQSPALLPKNQRLPLPQTGITPDEAFRLPFSLPQLSAVGFPMASISRTNRTALAGPHRKLRNEWWQISGSVITQSGQITQPFSLTIWRHTEIPEILWEKERTEQNYSTVKVAFTLDQESTTSAAFPESWKIAHISDEMLGIHFGQNYLQSHTDQTEFPATLNWENLHLNLDNLKPLCLLSSNGCVVCKDGIGLKKYLFPLISGTGELNGEPVTFTGTFEHSWEAGIFPQGFSSSLLLRSFMNIEKSLSFENSDKFGDYLYLLLHLNNGYQIFFYVFNFPKTVQTPFAPYKCLVVLPDGTTRVQSFTLKIQAMSGQNVTNLLISSKNQTNLCMTGLSPQGTTIPISRQSAYISGSYESEPVTGFGFLESSAFPKIEITNEIQKEIVYSWLLWVVPLLIILLLVCIVIYLIWSKRRARAWNKYNAGRSRKTTITIR